MISLTILLLTVQTAIYLINTIGVKTINELLWQLSASLPLPSSQRKKEQFRLRGEVVRLKREMNSISAQDDFARWAKARREHDRVLAGYDRVASQVSASRSQFDTIASGLRWITTSGLVFLLQFYHSKTPVFEYPRGWFPWYVEWVLGFPRCPYGGVSVNIWNLSCGIVVALAGELVGWGIALRNGVDTTKTATKEKVPVAMSASSGGQKKEL